MTEGVAGLTVICVKVGLTKNPRQPTAKASDKSAVSPAASCSFRLMLNMDRSPGRSAFPALAASGAVELYQRKFRPPPACRLPCTTERTPGRTAPTRKERVRQEGLRRKSSLVVGQSQKQMFNAEDAENAEDFWPPLRTLCSPRFKVLILANDQRLTTTD
jgi:hypothetical protein